MQETVHEYLRLEKDIEALNNQLKLLRERREKLGEKIVEFCETKGKNAIKLPDNSILKVYNNTKYQSLTYTMLEKNINNFNNSLSLNIPVNEFMKYLKNKRERSINTEVKHLST
jgi:hypothetical protein